MKLIPFSSRFFVIPLAVAVVFSGVAPAWSASFLDRLLGSGKGGAASVAELTQEQAVAGLREALAKGVQTSITHLGRADGFLKDVAVRIPVPESLEKVEKGLRAAGQGPLVDEFLVTMNRAAEKAVPQAAEVLADSIRSMTLADAKAILSSTNTAATEYFRRTSETNLHARFLPIVKEATDAVGVTAAYKKMTGKMNLGGLGGLGNFGGALMKNNEALDVDGYVTRKALDGLFVKIADQEKVIRENPAARTTELLQKVFGATRK